MNSQFVSRDRCSFFHQPTIRSQYFEPGDHAAPVVTVGRLERSNPLLQVVHNLTFNHVRHVPPTQRKATEFAYGFRG